MENKNNTLATQRALLKEHFDIELKCFKGLAKGYIIAKNAFLESSAEEISKKMDDYDYSSKKALIQAAHVEEIADTAMILKIITPDENTKIKCMLNDIFNGVYQERSDKRDWKVKC